MQTYTVSGIWPETFERWSSTLLATGFEDAEAKARELSCPEMLIASVVEGPATIHTVGRSADFGPGSPGYKVTQGMLNTDPGCVPSVGDWIYLPHHDGGHPSCPDGLPGVAQVATVEPREGYSLVSAGAHPGVSMNWQHLATNQEFLHEHYRYERAGMSDD
jgi:hypothetical protein